VKLRDYQDTAADFLYEHDRAMILAPVGAGKSLIHAEIIKRIHEQSPRTRILSLTHVKELLSQNANEMVEQYPHADFGMYCAGLG